ncbi:MAG: hypothetical protein JWR19_663 [Pedosphaera sp.]|jgi:hypothetical protein|nr:hypothetical protein [Pedosphaera sp.]
MKRILWLAWVVLGLGFLAGCATANSSGSAIGGEPTISGYIDTSAQKRF